MKKVKVSEDLCMACGFCMAQASEVFRANSQGFSEPKKEFVQDDDKDAIVAMEGCPTGAITLEDVEDKGETKEENCNCEHCECDHCECEHE